MKIKRSFSRKLNMDRVIPGVKTYETADFQCEAEDTIEFAKTVKDATKVKKIKECSDALHAFCKAMVEQDATAYIAEMRKKIVEQKSNN